MNKLLLLLSLTLSACASSAPVETTNIGIPKYRVGDTVMVKSGHYCGCHFEVLKVFIESYAQVVYVGRSIDCHVEITSNQEDVRRTKK